VACGVDGDGAGVFIAFCACSEVRRNCKLPKFAGVVEEEEEA